MQGLMGIIYSQEEIAFCYCKGRNQLVAIQ